VAKLPHLAGSLGRLAWPALWRLCFSTPGRYGLPCYNLRRVLEATPSLSGCVDALIQLNGSRSGEPAMKDLQDRLEKLRIDAEDCLLISQLATDRAKRDTFSRLATQLRGMAVDLEKTIASKAAGSERAPQ
jgi:hypothetical protein